MSGGVDGFVKGGGAGAEKIAGVQKEGALF